ncbi:MAG: FAD-binding and (Fe-S)-binding domain-containing protein [Actinomycetes bacterium]
MTDLATRPTVARSLADDLRSAVSGEVRFTDGDRSLYATDASNYRQLPLGVVIPRSLEDVVASVRIAREHGVPVLPRGGGTSLAGQCCNEAVVLDFTKYLDRIVDIDPERRVATVQPGVVLDELRAATAEHGLTFAPDPATHDHCALGGMIGNNSCGVHALMGGKTVDNVEWLDVLLYDGTRMRVGRDGEDLDTIIAEGGRRGEVYAALRDLRDRHLAALRTSYPDIPRRVSGYNLDSLLPENGFHVAQALVGSEGTLVTVLQAGLRLVDNPPNRTLAVLGYDDVAAAADAVPDVLESDPVGLEGIDHMLFELARQKQLHTDALTDLPGGRSWLVVELAGESQDEADGKASDLVDRLSGAAKPVDTRVVSDPEAQAQVWAVRESGLGATARMPDGTPAWPGWEDSAVAPDRLGDYIRDLKGLYDKYGYEAAIYGHFGQGCLHTRIPFDLVTAEGVDRSRAFLEEAAHLVCDTYGGSLSGEHGDGQARGELLPIMYGDELVGAFRELKAIFDPDNRMNPGKVVDPDPLDANLRLGTSYDPPPTDTAFAYLEDDGQFSTAALRCVGVGACRTHTSDGGGVMCPSYMVTREEKHSTRGRARLLWEMLNGGLRGEGWRSKEVNEALDLCLACKGCKSDCPVEVDMATYKAEFLHHHYARRLRPLSHYSMGWLPLWARLASVAPRAVNTVAAAPGLSRLLKTAGGVAQQRDLPTFAQSRFLDRFRAPRHGSDGGSRPRVVLWPDTFTNNLQPGVAEAAVEVLTAAGAEVTVPDGTQCCGLTWISTGQLGVARRVLLRAVRSMREELRAGTPVVLLEPSCAAVFRADARDLCPEDQDVQRLRELTYTLAEYLERYHPDWQPPAVDRAAVVQVHCHQHAVMHYDAEQRLLERAGVRAEVLDSGCCGLAGNFGFEADHYDVSMACAERVLLPRVRQTDEDTAVIADGFSCRTQVEQGGTGRRPLHVAEVLASGLRGRTTTAVPDDTARRPDPAPALAGRVADAAVGTAVVGAGALLVRQARRRAR